jgi:shikimate kinase
VAEALGVPFVDADERLASGEGSEVSEIVRRDGWEAFRRAESAMLTRILAEPPSVVSTRGGVVLSLDNRRALRAAGRVVYLRMRADIAASRLVGAGDGRPPLTAFGPAVDARISFADRDGIYRDVCHVIVDAEVDPDSVVATVVALA